MSLTGCLSSPEVKWADEAFKAQRYDEARVMYTRALGYNLHDDAERERVKRQLGLIRKELNNIKQAQFDALARKAWQKTNQNDKWLMLLINQVQDNDLSQTVRDEALTLLIKKATIKAQNTTPASLYLLDMAHKLILQKHPIDARTLHQKMGIGVLQALQASQRHNTLGEQWLKVTTASTTWQSYPNARAIKRERSKLAQIISQNIFGASMTDQQACNKWFKTKWDEPAVRAQIKKRCQQATAQSLQQIIRLANPTRPMTTRRALDRLASTLSLTSSQTAQGQATLNQLALPWRQKAMGAKRQQTKAYYFSLADSIDGKRSSLSTRTQLVRQAKSYKFPQVKLRNASRGKCRQDGQMTVRNAKFGSGSRSGGTVHVDLAITSCDSIFSISWKRIRVQKQTQRVCKDYSSTRKVVSQECRSGTRFDPKTGMARTHPCDYKVAVTKYNTVKSTHCSNKNSASLITERAKICTRVNLQAQGTIIVDGKVRSRHSAKSLKKTFCDYRTVTYLSNRSRPGFVTTAREQRQGRVSHFKKTILAKLQSAAGREQRKTYLRRLTPLKTKIARLKNSADMDDRIAAAVMVGQLNMAQSGTNTLKIDNRLETLAPERGMLVPLRQGKSSIWKTFTFESKHLLSQKKWRKSYTPTFLRLSKQVNQQRHKAKRQVAKQLYKQKRQSRKTLPSPMMWHSTGPHVSTTRGPAADWPGVQSPSGLALQVDFQARQHLTKQNSYLDTQWLASLALGKLHLAGGSRLGLGDTQGYNLAARWMPDSDAPHDPDISWSVGVLYDVIKPNDANESSSVRLPVEFNMPVLTFLSLNLALEPDIYHLADLASLRTLTPGETGLSASRLWLGGTLSLWRGRLIVHGGAGSIFSKDGVLPGIWRTQVGVRF